MEEEVNNGADPWCCWVQCDQCQKWRKLPGCTREEYKHIQASQMWTCDMDRWNALPARCFEDTVSSCYEAQEPQNSRQVIYRKVRRDVSRHILSPSTTAKPQHALPSTLTRFKSSKPCHASSSSSYETNTTGVGESCYGFITRRRLRGCGTSASFENKHLNAVLTRKEGQRRKKRHFKSQEDHKNGSRPANEKTLKSDQEKVKEKMKTPRVDTAFVLSNSSVGPCYGVQDEVCVKTHSQDLLHDVPVMKNEDPGSVRWAQCDFCQKWRCLPGCSEREYMELHQSNAPWRCSYNHWDMSRANCSVPEEKFSISGRENHSVTLAALDRDMDRELGENNPIQGFAWHKLPWLILEDLLKRQSQKDPLKFDAPSSFSFPSNFPLLHRCHELLVDYFLSRDPELVQSLKRLAFFCLNELRKHHDVLLVKSSDTLSTHPMTQLHDASSPPLVDQDEKDTSGETFQVVCYLFFHSWILKDSCEKKEEKTSLQDIPERYWIQLQNAFSSVLESPVPSCFALFQVVVLFQPLLDSLLTCCATPTTHPSCCLSVFHEIQRPDLIELLLEKKNTDGQNAFFHPLKEIPTVVLSKSPQLPHPLAGRVMIQSNDTRVEAMTLFPHLISLSCKNGLSCLTSATPSTMMAHDAPLEKSPFLQRTQDDQKQIIHIDLPSRLPWPTGSLVVTDDGSSTKSDDDQTFDDSSLPHCTLDDVSDDLVKQDTDTPSLHTFHAVWNKARQRFRARCDEQRLNKRVNYLLEPFQMYTNAQGSKCKPNKTEIEIQTRTLQKNLGSDALRQCTLYHSTSYEPSSCDSNESNTTHPPRASRGSDPQVKGPEVYPTPVKEAAVSLTPVSTTNPPSKKSCLAYLLETLKKVSSTHSLPQPLTHQESHLEDNSLLTFSSLDRIIQTDPLLDLCIVLTHLERFIGFAHWGSQFFQKIISSIEAPSRKQ